MISITVSELQAGVRLDKFVLQSLDEKSLTRSQILKNFDENVKVGGKLKSKGYKVRVGDVIEIDEGINLGRIKEDSTIVSVKGELDIIEETDNYIVLNKPKGTPVHPGRGHSDDTIANFLKYYLESKGQYDSTVIRAGIVHRLDKDVSGLLICAKNLETQRFLLNQFENRNVDKVYLAKIYSLNRVFPSSDYSLDVELERYIKDGIDQRWIKSEGSIRRDNANRKRMRFYEDLNEVGRYSLTYILPLENKEALISIKTGRMHQIRATLKTLGWVVVGDTLYGYKNRYENKGIDLQEIYLRIEVEQGTLKEWKLV